MKELIKEAIDTLRALRAMAKAVESAAKQVEESVAKKDGK